MAKTFALALIFVMLLAAPMVRSKKYEKPKELKFTVFFQVILAGQNANSAVVAGIPGPPRNLSEFGTVLVGDIPVTQGISLNSPEVGRTQGFQAISSLNGASAYDSFSIIFTNRQYNGSTLEFQGITVQLFSFTSISELSIVSGTKRFRFVRGYALFQAILQRPERNYSVLRANITIRFD